MVVFGGNCNHYTPTATVVGLEVTLMENVKFEVKGKTLTITVDLSHEGERSASGKTIRIASTCGNVPVPNTDTGAIIGLNIYRK